MQIKLSVLIIILVLIFVLFHWSGSPDKVNPPVFYRPKYEYPPEYTQYTPYVENYENYEMGQTPVVYTDQAYGPETGFTASFAPGGDAIIYSDGTPMEEVTPIQ